MPVELHVLKQWEQDFRQWVRRDLAGMRYVYFWADGIHFNVRLEDTENKRQCILVIIGAREDGTKELVAVNDGYRESKLSWMSGASSNRFMIWVSRARVT